MQERGVSEGEVVAALNRGTAATASSGRKAKETILPFGKHWQGRFYEQKKVRVIYVEANDELTVITVYAYFGKWEER